MNSQQSNFPTSRSPEPPENYPFAHHRDDEISLVDLALILIRRRWWVIGTGVAVVALAFVFALLTRGEPEYEFVTIYEVAEYTDTTGEQRPLQNTRGLMRRMESIHRPALQREYLAENPELRQMPFELRLSRPEDTNLIMITSVSAQSEQSDVEALHERLLAPVLIDQSQQLESRQNQLQNQIDSLQQMLDIEADEQGSSTPEIVMNYTDRLMDLSLTRDTMRNGEVIQYAARGEEANSGPGGSLILALGIMLGGFLGLMAGFFAEFGARVRDAMATQNS